MGAYLKVLLCYLTLYGSFVSLHCFLAFQARPAEVLVDGQNGELIRLPDTFESLMEPYLSAGKQTISPIVNA